MSSPVQAALTLAPDSSPGHQKGFSAPHPGFPSRGLLFFPVALCTVWDRTFLFVFISSMSISYQGRSVVLMVFSQGLVEHLSPTGHID